MQQLVIPTHLDTSDGGVELTRAWFERIDAGQRRLSFEGRDLEGRLRAGLVWFDDAARPTRIELAGPSTDPKLPALARLAPQGELLVHRAGRRAVLRTEAGYAKALRPGKLADALIRARALQSVGGPLVTPRVLSSNADGELTVDAVPGVSLHSLKGEDWRLGWQAWAEAWTEWVETPGLGHDLPRYTVDDEEQTLAGWLLRVELARPAGAALGSLRNRFGTVMEALYSEQRDVWRLSHRDLHDKQILVATTNQRRTAGLIDSDTLAVADPAVDLGNLLAHVHLREVQGLLDTQQAEAAEGLIRTVADGLRVPDGALAAWCDAASLRLSCVYAFRPAGTLS